MKNITEILRLLKSAYGDRESQPTRDPVSVLVKTILSQNTSDINSVPTFESLRKVYSAWEKVAQAEESSIAEVIKSGGLGQIKARRIKQALREIVTRHGRLELDFLDDLPLDEAREWLKQLPGVGDKTAGVVLLFAFGKPALPVDTHIFRVSKRLGLVFEKASLEQAHVRLGEMVPPDEVYAFHLLIIEHGRRTCTARSPRCPQCVLKYLCPSFEKFMGYKAISRLKVKK